MPAVVDHSEMRRDIGFDKTVNGLTGSIQRQRGVTAHKNVTKLVGAGGFELPTSCSQSRRSTRLSYAPDRPVICRLMVPASSKLLGTLTRATDFSNVTAKQRSGSGFSSRW